MTATLASSLGKPYFCINTPPTELEHGICLGPNFNRPSGIRHFSSLKLLYILKKLSSINSHPKIKKFAPTQKQLR